MENRFHWYRKVADQVSIKTYQDLMLNIWLDGFSLPLLDRELFFSLYHN